MEYRVLEAREINRELFSAFIRRQVVTKCWRKEAVYLRAFGGGKPGFLPANGLRGSKGI